MRLRNEFFLRSTQFVRALIVGYFSTQSAPHQCDNLSILAVLTGDTKLTELQFKKFNFLG